MSADEVQAIVGMLGYVEGRAPATQMQEVAYAFLIALETAMRKGEILGLAVADVFLSQRFVRLSVTKNGDARDVPLSRQACVLMGVLLETATARGDAALFRVTSGNADMLFRRAREKLGIQNLHFHDTRHEANNTPCAQARCA